MHTLITTLVLAAVAAMPGAALAAEGPPAPRKERVQFAKGASSATVKGRITGNADVDYLVRASAGQTLTVTIKASNPQNYFNVLPPGTGLANPAMFVGTGGGEFKAVLPDDGDYAVRVYLMRAAARRNESSQYTLTVAVDGRALPPLPAAKDALVPGTPFHATTQVPCTPPFDSKPQQCSAGVIRRGNDGTATVELAGGNNLKRRILFVKGQAVASDAPDLSGAGGGSARLANSREGDRNVVKVGEDERYEIPDALLTGG
jgi:hypothetical protein